MIIAKMEYQMFIYNRDWEMLFGDIITLILSVTKILYTHFQTRLQLPGKQSELRIDVIHIFRAGDVLFVDLDCLFSNFFE